MSFAKVSPVTSSLLDWQPVRLVVPTASLMANAPADVFVGGKSIHVPSANVIVSVQPAKSCAELLNFWVNVALKSPVARPATVPDVGPNIIVYEDDVTSKLAAIGAIVVLVQLVLESGSLGVGTHTIAASPR